MPRGMQKHSLLSRSRNGMGTVTEASGRNQGSSELQGDPEAQQLLSKGVKAQAAAPGLRPTPELTAIAMGAHAASETQSSGSGG